ncbi:MAG: CapA family protein, partial [Clostridia bacterium]|nr:CapA family protein [Clostridia bacterium]
MNKKQIGSLLLVWGVLFSFSGCQQTAEGDGSRITYVTAPAPAEALEENALLRRPDAAADPSVYAAVTEAPPAESGAADTQGETVTEEPQTSGVSEEARISFVAVGDNILHSAIMEDAANHAGDGEEYDFTYIYDNVRDVISAADVAFVNQETLLGGKSLGYYGYPNFNGPQEAGDALVDAGFDIVCIATNHMCDMNEAGLLGTIEYWEEQPVTLIGGYRNAEDYENIRVHEKDGVKIALLAYTYDPYTTNGMKLPVSSELITPIYNEEVIRRQV